MLIGGLYVNFFPPTMPNYEKFKFKLMLLVQVYDRWNEASVSKVLKGGVQNN